METDDGVRGQSGVVFCLRELTDGKVRVYMDDVKNENTPSKGPWVDRGLVTWKDYDEKELEEMDFSEQELAGIGSYVLARLLASKKHPHK